MTQRRTQKSLLLSLSSIVDTLCNFFDISMIINEIVIHALHIYTFLSSSFEHNRSTSLCNTPVQIKDEEENLRKQLLISTLLIVCLLQVYKSTIADTVENNFFAFHVEVANYSTIVRIFWRTSQITELCSIFSCFKFAGSVFVWRDHLITNSEVLVFLSHFLSSQ